MKQSYKSKYFLVSTYEMIASVIFSFPRHRLFGLVKSFFLRLQGAKVGKRVVFYPGIKINPASRIEIGDDVDFAWGVIVTTRGGVKIGARTLIGYNTHILTSNHVIPNGREPIFKAGHEYKKVEIGKDVWIGANCIILPGVTIGEGAVVGAGSIVTKDVPSFVIVAGNPAIKIQKR